MSDADAHRLAARADLAALAVRTGGAVHRHYWGHPDLQVVAKSANQTDIATVADKTTELVLASVIATARDLLPTTVIGEEGIYELDQDGRVSVGAPVGRDDNKEWRRPGLDSYWLVDGLDGTNNFRRQIPLFCTSAAYVDGGEVVVGAVYMAATDELLRVHRGATPTRNGHALKARALPDSLADVMIDAGAQPIAFKRGPPALVRSYGAPILALCHVAAGGLDAYRHLPTAPKEPQRVGPWDLAAGSLLVLEAGGAVAGPAGAPFDLWSGGILAASSALLIERLNEATGIPG